MSDTIKTQAAILVDYNLYAYNVSVRSWLSIRKRRAPETAFVLLVSDPAHEDYDAEDKRWNGLGTVEMEFDAVIRNSGGKRDITFKLNALHVIKDVSNLIPVLALEEDLYVQQMFEDNGVLIAQGEEELCYV